MARYATELPQRTLLKMLTLDHGLDGPEHEETMQEIVDFLAK